MNLRSCTIAIFFWVSANAQENFRPIADSAIDALPPSRYYFIGQAHNNKANLPLEQEMLFILNRRWGLRYDILEYGHSTAVIVNEFLRTGADSLLKFIHPEAAFTFFKSIKKFNDTIAEERKIYFYGIDFEGRHEYKHLKKAIDIVLHKTMLHDTTTLYGILNRIRSGQKETIPAYLQQLKNHLDQYETRSRNLLGSCYTDLLLIANAQNGFSPRRDVYMYANFKRLYSELKKSDANPLFLSSFGYAHIDPSNTKSIANRLQEADDSPVRGSVAVIGIQYYQSSFHQNEIKKWTGNLSFLCNKKVLQNLETKDGVYFLSRSRLASLSCNPNIKKLAALILISKMSSTQNYIWE